MSIKESFGIALKTARVSKKITQEDFSDVSSRTYISTLERGLYSPTIEKTNDLAKVIGIHPLTILGLAFMINENSSDISAILERVSNELRELKVLV